MKRLLDCVGDFFNWIKKSENRKVAFVYFRMGLELAKKAVKHTKTSKDDRGLQYLTQVVDDNLQLMTDQDAGP